MPRNKIGIEVDIQFPTIKELQQQLAEKWARVKNNFEAKVNLGIDGNSLRKFKADIQRALDERIFEVKLGTDSALKNISKINDKLDSLDKKLKKNREIKIGFNIADMDKTLREIIAKSKDMGKSQQDINKALQEQGKTLQANLDKYSKLEEKTRRLKDGSRVSTQTITEKRGLGVTQLDTYDSNGNHLLSKTVHDRAKALKEIKEYYDEIYKINKEQIKAEGTLYDKLEQNKQELQKQLALLEEQYRAKYNVANIDDKAFEQYKNLQKETLEYERQKQELSDIEKAVSRVAQLEKQRGQAQRKLLTATDDEKKSALELINHYTKAQQAIIEKYNLQERMTAEQRAELEQIVKINEIENNRIRAKIEQAERQKVERDAYNDIYKSLKDVQNIELQILAIKEKQRASGLNLTTDEQLRLNILEKELELAKKNVDEATLYHTAQGNVTNSVKEQLALQQSIYQRERERVAEVSKVAGENQKVSEKLRELEDITKRINRLQRDLIFAGMRERTVIEDAVDALRRQRAEVEKNLEEQGALTDEIKQQIRRIDELSARERELARLRRESREKDMAYNDTGGLVNPYDFMNAVERGARAVIEPVARLDEALTGVAKVADATDEQLQDFAKGAFESASELGLTADKYMDAVERWVTAGKDFESSQELAKISEIGAFVGNIDDKRMVDYMSVPLSAFEKEGVKATDIINTMNEVSNQNAIEMEDLGKAYQRSATTAKNAGVSFGELTGMITAAQEATRKGGERIGTGIKSIAMNVGILSARLTGDAKKKFNWFKDTLGISLTDAEGDAKSLTQVLDELSKKWDKMNKEQKTTAEYYLAGKEHAETLAGILDRWDVVKKNIDITEGQMGLGTEGSAYIEHSKQEDSVKFKLAELKNAWDELLATIAGGREGASGVLDVLIDGLKELNKLATNDEFMKAMKYIFAGVAIHAGTNLYLKFLDTVKTGFMSLKKDASELAEEIDNLFPRKSSSGSGASVDHNTRQGRRGSNSNGDVYVGGVGSRVARNSRKNNKSRTSGAEIEVTNREIEETAKNTSKGRGLLRVGGKLLGFIPIIGDILLLADFLGADVFGNIAEGFHKLVNGAKQTAKEIDKKRRQFEARNPIENGKLYAMKDEAQGTIQTDKNGNPKRDKNGNVVRKGGFMDEYEDMLGKKGYLAHEQFLKLKQEVEEFAKENGLIDIHMNVNNAEEIKKVLKQVDDQIKQIETDAINALGKQTKKQFRNMNDAKDDKATKEGQLDWLYGKANSAYNRARELEAKGKKNGGLSAEDMNKYKENIAEYNAYMDKIKKIQHDIRVDEEIIAKSKANIDKDAKTIAEHLAKGGSIKGLSKDQTVTYIASMVKQNNKLAKQLDSTSSAYKKLISGQKLSREEYNKLVKVYPKLNEYQLKEINSNKDIRKEVQGVVKAKRSQQSKEKDVLDTAVHSAAKQIGLENQIQDEKKGTIKLEGKLKDKVKEKNDEINRTPKKKETSWTFKVGATISAWAKKAIEFLSKHGINFGDFAHFKVTSVGGIKTKGKDYDKDNSVSSASPSKPAVGAGGVSSASVSSAGTSTGGNLVKTPASVASVDNATSSTKEPPATVSSDVWRYWGTEIKIDSIASAINKLSDAISRASDNQDELIKLYTKQNSLLKTQEAYNRTLSREKSSELSSVLRQLRGYGFHTSGTNITNLSHAKAFKGDKATKVEDLLNTWKSLISDISGISDTISSLEAQIKQNNDAIKQAKIDKEYKSFEDDIKRINALLTKVNNADSISNTRLNLVGNADKELALQENERAMNTSKQNLSDLINEFNKLSKATINYKENGEQLQSSLQSLGQQIIAEADAIIQYQQALNDLEFNRVTSDLQDFSNAVSDNSSRISNNIKNLKEGLLSGTDIGDLESSKGVELDLNRNNRYEQLAQERINLEKEVDDALSAFAKKNIDRVRGVSNATLDINKNMYNQLLKMQKDYTNGLTVSYSKIVSTFGDLKDIGLADQDYTFVKDLEKYFKDVEDKQIAITEKYKKDMAKAKSQQEKDDLTNQYIMDSLKAQEDYLNATIKANQDAIDQLQKQLSDPTLTDDQEEAIKDAIKNYEQAIIDAQNNIKETIKDRFDFEFSLIQKSIDEYDKHAKQLQYVSDILNDIKSNDYGAQGVLLEQMFSNEKSRNQQIASSIESLKQQLSLYEEGSYEWNIINEQIEQYNDLLMESNKQLLNMNKNILDNSFNSTLDRIEKVFFNGKTLDQFNRFKDIWMDGIEKEIALENTYKRIADLQTHMFDQKMEQLSKEEKLSRFEMEYLNKQLDVLELQQKVDNLNKEKTVQTLKQNADGTWQWVYEADQTQLSQAQKDLEQAQLELEQEREDAQKDYISHLQEILDDAKNGQYSSVDDLKNAITDLGEAYQSIIGDIPEMQDDYIQSLLDAYSQYIQNNNDVLNGSNGTDATNNPSNPNVDTNYKALGTEIANAFEKVSADIGEAFANAIVSKLQLPSKDNGTKGNMLYYAPPAEKATSEEKAVNITLESIEFPSIKTADGIKDAIMSLPQVALQKAKDKL